MNNQPLWIILDNIRSTANVGSIIRTANATGVARIYVCGYTPYPAIANDTRPPHVIASNAKGIAKTALGAELIAPLYHTDQTFEAIAEAKKNGFKIIILEQAENSLTLNDLKLPGPAALIVGNEVAGVSPDILEQADCVVEIPMLGTKESYGVAVASGIALHHLRFMR